MLARFIVIAALAAAAATQIPALLQSPSPENRAPENRAPAIEIAAPVAATPAGSVQLAADGNGHYNGSFRINGKPVEGLIDTGATFVALNESTARRLGFTANGLDFAYAVNTANGQTKAAHITLDRIEIGSLRVRQVEAFVLRDAALSQTLVGMSFLQKLGSYRVADGTLELRQ